MQPKYYQRYNDSVESKSDMETYLEAVLDATNGAGVAVVGDPTYQFTQSPKVKLKDTEGFTHYSGDAWNYDGSPVSAYLLKYAKKWSLPVTPVANPHPVLTMDNWPSLRVDLSDDIDSTVAAYQAEGMYDAAEYNRQQASKLTLERGFWIGSHLGFPWQTNWDESFIQSLDSSSRGTPGEVQVARLSPYLRFHWELCIRTSHFINTFAPPTRQRCFNHLTKYRRKGVNWMKAAPDELVLPKGSKQNMYAQTFLPTCTSTPAGKTAAAGITAFALRYHWNDAATVAEQMVEAASNVTTAKVIGLNARYQEGGDRPMPIMFGDCVNPQRIGVHTNLFPRVRALGIPPYPISALMTPEVQLGGYFRSVILPLFFCVADAQEVNRVFAEASAAAGLPAPPKITKINREFWSMGGIFSHNNRSEIAKKLWSIKNNGSRNQSTKALDVPKFDSRNSRELLRFCRLGRHEMLCRTSGAPFSENHVPRIEDYRPLGPKTVGTHNESLIMANRNGVLESGCQDTSEQGKDANGAATLYAFHVGHGIHPAMVYAGCGNGMLNQGDDSTVCFELMGMSEDIWLEKYVAAKALTGIPDEPEDILSFLRVYVNPKINPFESDAEELGAYTTVATRGGARWWLRDFGKLPAPHMALSVVGMHSALAGINPLSVRRHVATQWLTRVHQYGNRDEFNASRAVISRAIWDWDPDDAWELMDDWINGPDYFADVWNELRATGRDGQSQMQDRISRLQGDDDDTSELIDPLVSNLLQSEEDNSTITMRRQRLVSPIWAVRDSGKLSFNDVRLSDTDNPETEADVLRRIAGAQRSQSYINERGG